MLARVAGVLLPPRQPREASRLAPTPAGAVCSDRRESAALPRRRRVRPFASGRPARCTRISRGHGLGRYALRAAPCATRLLRDRLRFGGPLPACFTGGGFCPCGERELADAAKVRIRERPVRARDG